MLSFLRDISLRSKITISFVLIVICGTSISTFLGSKIITRAMLNEAHKQIRHGLKAAEMVYSARLETVRRSVKAAAETEELAASLAAGRGDPSPGALARLRDDHRLHFLTFVNGGKSTRAYTENLARDTIPPVMEEYVREALSGRTSAGTELFSRAALEAEDPALSEKALIASSGEQKATAEGMVLISATPVKTTAGFTGVLYGGILLNRNAELVNQINNFVFGGEEQAGDGAGTVSIFMNDVRVASNIVSVSGRHELGTRIPDEVRKTVLAEGGRYYGTDYIAGNWHLTAYEPIRSRLGRIIGILYVGIPENPFLAVRTSMMLTFLLVAGIGVLVVLVITYFITRSMILPLEEMVKASNRIAAGDFDHSVAIQSNDEIGILADSFNKMSASIKTMKLELEEWGRTLEEKVNKRTEELVAVQTQMAQSEKLASIGRLAAGVAHEINNPLGGILTFSMLALEECDDDHPLKPSLEVIVKQTLRCRETVKGLLDFARQSSATPSITEVNTVVDKTLLLLENQTMFQNIRTVRKFDQNLPNVLIDAGQLQQVVMNIVINAVDAMEESGTLTIETCDAPQTQEILIRISDTGKGIPDDVLPLIFEPFFTTKKVGKGTGLGLAIVHGIVTRAGGTIEVSSSSQGAIFTVRLPIAREDRKVGQDSDIGAGQPA
ncbi:MAG: HAMP domain-containing protein [Acidobacteria bacterium]|nr:HAMP domain-containing protein [Acidobacteriota bacterium]